KRNWPTQQYRNRDEPDSQHDSVDRERTGTEPMRGNPWSAGDQKGTDYQRQTPVHAGKRPNQFAAVPMRARGVRGNLADDRWAQPEVEDRQHGLPTHQGAAQD